MDPYFGLAPIIREAIKAADSAGKDYTGQTGAAVRAVMAVRADMGAPETLKVVKRWRAENGNR